MRNEIAHVCKILAHRGANRLAPENTQAAFDKAFEHAVDGVETDVQLSKDGIPVLWHDSELDKLGLSKQRVDDFDFKQLKAMHFVSTAQNTAVMGLAEFFARYRGRGTLNVEVKIGDWESELRQQHKISVTLDLIARANIDDVFVSSFNLQSLVFAHQYSRQTALFYLLSDRQTPTDIAHALQEQPFLAGFCLPIGLLDETLIPMLRRHDKRIVTYTCNNAAEIHKALDLKVDFLITDDLVQALRLRSRCRGIC